MGFCGSRASFFQLLAYVFSLTSPSQGLLAVQLKPSIDLDSADVSALQTELESELALNERKELEAEINQEHLLPLNILMRRMVTSPSQANAEASQKTVTVNGGAALMSNLHTAVPLSRNSSKIKFVTVYTNNDLQLRLPGPVGWDWKVDNAGAGKKWNGYKTKIGAMQEWIKTLDDDQLVAAMDGGDVMYGGCSSDDLVDRFDAITKATGASVIFGAEYNCYEPPTAGCSAYPGQGREKVLQAFNLKANEVDSWGLDQVSQTGLDPSTAKLRHMELKYLNSGFYMGRVKHLREFYGHMARYTEQPTGDQGWAAQVLQDRPDFVALDYAGVLVNNLFGVRLDEFSYDGNSKKWMNKATGRPVCFFHGNGQAKPAFEKMVAGQTDMSAIANDKR